MRPNALIYRFKNYRKEQLFEITNSSNQGAVAPSMVIMFNQNGDGKSRILVWMKDGTIWLNQRLLA